MQDSHQKIAYKRQKPIIIELNFEKISKTEKNSKAKPRNLRGAIVLITQNFDPA